MRALLGVDIGTQGLKAVVVDGKNNETVAQGYTEYNSFSPDRPAELEHDPEEVWWKGFKKIVNVISEKSPVSLSEVDAVGISAITPCFLPFSTEKSASLRPALIYSDTRGSEEVGGITDRLGKERLYRLTRNPLSTHFVGPKLLWFKKNEPRKFDNMDRIFTASNYVVFKLTKKFVLDYPQAAFFSPFYKYDEKTWNLEVIEEFSIPQSAFPEIKKPAEIAGYITDEAARETGLPEETPVVVSTGDAFAQVVSSGVKEKGRANLLCGTSTALMVTVENPPEIDNLMLRPHPLKEKKDLLGGAMSTTGALARWFRDNFVCNEEKKRAEDDSGIYELLDERANNIPPGSQGLLVLPYFSGERTPINDPLARGALLGLTLFHSGAHIYRALLEGAAYALQHHIRLIEDNGIEIEEIVSSGGVTKSELWAQIISSVTGYSQIVAEGVVRAEKGAAYLAGLGIGSIEDLDFIGERINSHSHTVKPDREASEIYQKYFSVYVNLYGKIKKELHSLVDLS